MGSPNELTVFAKPLAAARGPVLEIGSHDYGNTINYRRFFPGQRYVGVDMESGAGVDVVADMTAPLEVLKDKLGSDVFKTVICCSILEHCQDPFALARNVEALLGRDGTLLLAVPVVWRFHGYPSDYWRFTPEGVKALFKGLHFDEAETMMYTDVEGEVLPFRKHLFRFEALGRPDVEARLRPTLVVRILLRLLRLAGSPLVRYPFIYPPSMIGMVGRRGMI